MHTKVLLNIFEAIIHGGIIMGAMLLTLPQVRIQGGRLLPIGALHMSVFLLFIAVGNCRYIFQNSITKLRFLFLTCKTIIVFSFTLLISSYIDPGFSRVSIEIFTILSTYDSCTAIINTLLFCAAISFFFE